MASSLRFETLIMPAAHLGGDNPLPPRVATRGINELVTFGADMPDEVVRQARYGRVNSQLPYTMQNEYDRQLKARPFQVAILENEWLRATFLLEQGGRLSSLIYLPTGEDLLYCNPIFQPANLAIRNAWFSGGIEWNVSTIGHTPFTCAPLFAEELTAADGTAVLRLREFERIRQIPWQIDFRLPPNSPFLYVHVTIANPHAHEIPMYWWSNIAVPEAPGARVLAPGDEAFRFDYSRQMNRVPMPFDSNGIDVTYPTNIDRAADFFFDIAPKQRPWIAQLDREGRGLFQTSTARLRGRKFFVWGMSTGGRHWQDFLSTPNNPYIEIQAGLAQTQSEHLPMPPQSLWQWSEAYGLLEAPKEQVHGGDWSAAWRCADARLQAILPDALLQREAAIGAGLVRTPAHTLRHRASGWGALEARRRGLATLFAEMPSLSDGSDSLTALQAPWITLLEEGHFPASDPTATPGAWMIQEEWRQLLETSIKSGQSKNWLAWLHLGVMRYAREDFEGAAAAWQQSLALQPSGWALRNLALLATRTEEHAEAARLLLAATKLLPALVPLAIECGDAMLRDNQHSAWLAHCDSMPPALRANGRIQALEARASINLADFDTAEEILRGKIDLVDLREGENILTNLWFEMVEGRLAATLGKPLDAEAKERAHRENPPPSHLDFRSHGKK